MAKQNFKIINWPTYNKALKERGSLTVWMDESSIAVWYEKTSPEWRGRIVALLRHDHHNDPNDETRVWPFSEDFTGLRVDSIFKLMGLPLKCPDYSLLSKRAKDSQHQHKNANTR